MTTSSPSGAAGSEPRTGLHGFRLPAAARIGSGRDIRRIIRTGDRRRGPLVDVFYVPSDGPRSRFAVVVPGYGHGAVARNRVKRRLRELVRREWLPVACSGASTVDLVLRAKPGAYGASYERLQSTLQHRLADVCAP